MIYRRHVRVRGQSRLYNWLAGKVDSMIHLRNLSGVFLFPRASRWRLLAGILLLAGIRTSPAGSAPEAPPRPADDPFHPGTLALEVMAGGSASALFPVGQRRDIALAGVELRLGYMLTGPFLPGWLRGNEEGFLLLTARGVVQGPGSYVAGGGFGLRHNFFLFGKERIVPYFQGSFAVTGNDIYRDQRQRQIGGPLEFVLKSDAGVRIRLDDRKWLRFEAGYEHISNARIYQRNNSFNGLGGSVGLSWTY